MEELIQTLKAEAPDFKAEVATYKATLTTGFDAQQRSDTFKYHTKSVRNSRSLVDLVAELAKQGYEVDSTKLVVFNNGQGFKLYYKRTDAELADAIKKGKADITQKVKEYRLQLTEKWLSDQVEQTLAEQAKAGQDALQQRQDALKKQLLDALK